jgi:hypothetical protein
MRTGVLVSLATIFAMVLATCGPIIIMPTARYS